MADELIWHWMQPGGETTVPRRHIFLDVGMRQRKERSVYVGQWGGASALYRSAPKGRKVREYIRGYDDAVKLWAEVDSWAKPRNRTVLWCWDLSACARLAACFTLLPKLGWDIMAWSVMPQSCWFIWRNGDRSLTMVDLQSVFPFGRGDLDANFQTVTPVTDENTDAWGQRIRTCAKNAQTARNAVVAYLDWVERERLGAWQLTGTGQGFAAYRSKFYTDPLLIHWDDDARAAERRAIWAGRTEAYWHGTLRGKRVDEWDLTQAYPRIALRDEIPVELCKTVTTDDEVARFMAEDGYAVLAEVEACTEVPVVPTSHDERILWPVGRFDTTLWDPELRLLHDVGGSFTVRRAWIYRTAPALQEWARWITRLIDPATPDVPAWQRAIAKHWGMGTIGRLGMQHDVWEMLGTMPRVGIRWWTQKDMDTGVTNDLVHVGTRLWESTGKVDWSMSVPAVPGWIASRCREMLTRLWLEVGDRTVIYADTDSLFAEGRHADRIHAVARRHPEWGLRLKRSWRRITILGPRQLVTGDRVRVSGVPVRAALLADGSLAGEVRESLRGSIANARTATVRVTPRRWHLREVDRRRQVGADGWTEPIRLPVQLDA